MNENDSVQKNDFDQGYDQGFDIGYNEGFNQGFIQGYQRALNLNLEHLKKKSLERTSP